MPITSTPGGTTFTGDSIRAYQAHVVASALVLMSKGIKANRTVTRKGLLATAGQILGKKQTDVLAAAAALREWANQQVSQ